MIWFRDVSDVCITVQVIEQVESGVSVPGTLHSNGVLHWHDGSVWERIPRTDVIHDGDDVEMVDLGEGDAPRVRIKFGEVHGEVHSGVLTDFDKS